MLFDCIRLLPNLFAVFDDESRYRFLNVEGARWLGFSGPDEALGRTHFDIRCKAVEFAENWAQQDKLALQDESIRKYISYSCYAKEHWRVVYVVKKKIYCEKSEKQYISCQVNDITNDNLLDITRFIMKENSKKIDRQQFCYKISKINSGFLTQQQSKCLFFLLRGKTAKEIAKIMSLSYRTVEHYLDAIKSKFNCDSKNDLIEKAIFKGYYNIVPESFFGE